MTEKRTRIRFNPHPTITHEDLIDILREKWANVDISEKAWNEMNPDLKRHFEEVT